MISKRGKSSAIYTLRLQIQMLSEKLYDIIENIRLVYLRPTLGYKNNNYHDSNVQIFLFNYIRIAEKHYFGCNMLIYIL